MAEWEAALEKLKAAYAAWHDTKGKSVEAWLDLIADTIDFRSLADGRLGLPWTETRIDRAGVRRYLAGLTTDMTMIHMRVDRFVCQDDCIVAIGSTAWRHNATGKSFDTPKVDVWRFRDGKAIAFYEYYDTAKVGEAAAVT